MWLSRYLEYTAENEAPEVFHFWCGIAILSHALNRKVWIDQHFDHIYPGQMMVCLVSDSAVSRKSTAINIAVNLLSALPDLAINIISGKTSNATLVDSLYRIHPETGEQLDSIGFLVADELGSFLSRESWAETLVTDITALNTQCDRPFRRHMRTRDVELINPCLGGLFGTTPTGLACEIPRAAQTAGMLGRMLIVHSEETERINDLLDPPKNMKSLYGWLLKELYRIGSLRGPFAFTPDGKAFYRQWYKKFREQAPRGSDERTGFYGRKHTHVLRTAAILSAARNSSLLIDAAVLDAAVMALDLVERELALAFRKLDTTNPLFAVQERILFELGRLGGKTTRTKLMTVCYARCGPYFTQALSGLIESKQITASTQKTKTKPSQWLEIPKTRGELMEAMSNDDEASVVVGGD